MRNLTLQDEAIVLKIIETAEGLILHGWAQNCLIIDKANKPIYIWSIDRFGTPNPRHRLIGFTGNPVEVSDVQACSLAGAVRLAAYLVNDLQSDTYFVANDYVSRALYGESAVEYNDAPERTKDDVLEVLQQVQRVEGRAFDRRRKKAQSLTNRLRRVFFKRDD